eukprot:SAG31_NODE_4813_length_2941_cov_5.007741_2_plen_523_part_00
MVAPFALVLALVTQAAAIPSPGTRGDLGSTATAAAEQVALAAQQLRGDATVAAALTAVKVGTAGAEQALAALGFDTALDLQLLTGGPEAAELMTTLSTGGELSIADRAKIRLLVGDQTHVARVARTMSLPTEDVADVAASRPPSWAATAGFKTGAVTVACCPPTPLRSCSRFAWEFVATCSRLGHPTERIGTQGSCSASTTSKPGSWQSSRTGHRHRSGGRRAGWTTAARQSAGPSASTLMPGKGSVSASAQTMHCSSCPQVRVAVQLVQSKRVCHRAVVACAKKLEATQPTAFAELYTNDYSMKNPFVKDDGSISINGFDPTNIDMKGLTLGAASKFLSYIASGASPAVLDVFWQDFMAFLVKHAYVRELPQAFLDLMAADLDGPLAEDYRVYIRHEIKPVLDRMKDIVHAHFRAIEMPSLEWLIETFPAHGKSDSPNVIVDDVVGYARAWDGVLVEWDAGRLDVLFPPSHMMPFLAMYKLNTWSKERGETKQHELIGMSRGTYSSTKLMAALETFEKAGE